MITNLTSITIYQNPKIILLGDEHTLSNCQENGIEIDDLLKRWIQYNEVNNIVTNFFAEVFFTKSTQKIIKEGSPLQLLPNKIPCFNKNKCFNHVKLHYVDIRSIVVDNISVSVDPFNLMTLKYLALHGRVSVDQIIDIIMTIETRYMDLFHFMLLSMNYNKIIQFLKLDKSYTVVFDHIEEYAVIRDNLKLTRAGASLYKLRKSNLSAFQLLISFIYKKAKLYMETINFDQELKQLEIFRVLNDKSVLNDALDSVDNKLLPLGALIMDAYTLSRMLYYKAESQEIIIYAGYKHIDTYNEFFNLLGMKPDVSIFNKDKCIDIDALNGYLDINLYL